MRDAHPDAGGDAELARRLNRAYEVLADPATRARYDETLPAGDGGPAEPLAYRFGVSIGRYAARWTRAVREAKRHASGRD